MTTNATAPHPHSQDPSESIDPEILQFYGPGLALVAFDLVLEEKRRQVAPVQPTLRMATRAEQHAAGVQHWRERAQAMQAAAAGD